MNEAVGTRRLVRFTLPPAARRVCRKRPRESVSVWAERHVRLPATVTSREGPLRFARSPYLVDPVDAWGELWLRRGVLCMAPQTGKTLGSYVPLLWAMDRAPAPAVLVLSDEDGARKMLGDYLTPIVRETRELRTLFSGAKADATSHVLRLKNGMIVRGAWATSAAKLKSSPYRYAIGDEVDDWPLSAGERGGDPEALLDVRLRTYPKTSKLWLVSSPGGPGGIWSKLLGCAQVRVYFARCPTCRAEQRLVWPRVRWPGGKEADPAAVESKRLGRYVCCWCEAEWDDADRDRAVREGRWVAVERSAFDPEQWDAPLPQVQLVPDPRPVSVGWHLASWYSPLVSLSKVIADFLRAVQVCDPMERVETLRAWTNNHPAKPWLEDEKPEIDAAGVLKLRDDRPAGLVPSGTLVLTAGVDTQDDGFWYEVRAWGEGMTSWGVRYGFVPEWEGLKRVLLEDRYRDASGGEHAVGYVVQDSAGHRAAEVYDWCRSTKVQASRGEQRMASPVAWGKIDTYPGTSKPIPGGLKLLRVNTTHFKDALARRLKVAPADPGAWLLHGETGADYAAHFSAEYRDPSGVWKLRGGQANHLWDCAVLNLAAVEVLGVRHWRPEPGPPPPRPKPEQPKERSKLW